MPVKKETLKVRLETVEYFGIPDLKVAIDVAGKEVYLTTPAIESILNWGADNCRKKIASKSLETFACMGLVPVKKSATIVNSESAGNPRLGVFKLSDVSFLIAWDACINQNPAAIALLQAGFEDSFRSLALERFDLGLTAEQRQERGGSRLQSALTRRTLTDWIRDWLEAHTAEDSNQRKFLYANVTDRLNQALTGHKAAHWKTEGLVPASSQSLRDYFSDNALRKVRQIEELTIDIMREDLLSPMDAMELAIASSRLKAMPDCFDPVKLTIAQSRAI